MKQAIKELAEKRRKWVEANRENGFEVGLKRLLTDIYPDNAHFIYELLQNAEDAHAKEVRFILCEDSIEFEHDGERLFTLKDIEAITSIGFSTKWEDVTNIGKFGVGFKAVFAYTDTPEIESNKIHFRIINMVVPESDGLSESFSMDGQTRFILPFDNSKKPSKQAVREIETLLRALGATSLLFLTHIRKIEYLLADSSLGYSERIDLGKNRFEIRLKQPGELTHSSTCFLKFDKDVQVEDEEAEKESQRVKSCQIAVAFGLKLVEAKADEKEENSGVVDAISEWELVPMEPGRVCIYFPAEKETSNLRLHLHAPFASTVARDSVRDCTGNNALRDHLADLLSESISAIRDQGLLTVRALAVLPNNKDNLSGFFQPLMDRLVEEFKVKNLVPMKSGGHASAVGIFRGTKVITDLIEDDDMVKLLGDGYVSPIWASNPSQRNQREDNFLSILGIEQWGVAELVVAMGRLTKNDLGKWMDNKDDKWHQNLYEMLITFINAAPKYPESARMMRISTIKELCLVCCSDGIYRKGSECFFPTEAVQCDDRFPRVSKGVFFAGKVENTKARVFLEIIGVCDVGEKVEIEYILKERYSEEGEDKELFKPELNDLARFIQFAAKHPDDIKLFKGHNIFKLENGKWGNSNQVYLDAPFMNTGLNFYYQIIGSRSEQWSLSKEYMINETDHQKIGEFAKKLGVITHLRIIPKKGYYSIDYTIEHIEEILSPITINASRLIWQTFVSQEDSSSPFFYKKSRRDGRYKYIRDGDSSIIAILKKYAWIPQTAPKVIDFVQPQNAIAEKLPEGFRFQTDWEWLKVLEFGLRVSERSGTLKLDREQQSQEYKWKEEVAKNFGFNSPEEAEELAKLKKENHEEFNKFKESISSKREHPTFPTRPVANPERRQERLGEQLTDAPAKEYEKRERSVRTTNGAIDPITSLRELYTNEDHQMVCQICKEEMPFRKRNGAHYFEKKEVLSKKFLPKEHEAQYLALCPLCAAKYSEFVKTDDEVMAKLKKEIFNAEACEIPLSLGDEKTSIRFVEKHLYDLKAILGEGE
jgi:hypothetical protein